MNVLSGICIGGPKNGQTLATMQGRRVPHPGDPNGAYFFKPAAGADPARWIWVANKEKSK